MHWRGLLIGAIALQTLSAGFETVVCRVGWVFSSWTASNLKRWCSGVSREMGVFLVHCFNFETVVCIVVCLCVRRGPSWGRCVPRGPFQF